MRRIATLTLLSTVFLTLAGCSSAGKPASKLSDRQRALYLVEAARGSLIESDPIGALQYLKAAEQADPETPEIYHVQALAFEMRKERGLALESMAKCVRLEPNNSSSNNTYGKLLLDAGRNAEAETYLKKAASDQTFREAYKAKTSLGMLYYRQGQTALADQFLERATNDDPINACIAYYYRGHIAMKSGRLQQATGFYEKASTKHCAGFADAHLALGISYERNQRYDLARKKFVEVQQNFPSTPLSDQAMQRLKRIP